MTALSKTSENEEEESGRGEERELFMANLLNEFQMRGIKIREKYPSIYRRLCLYVAENRPFTPCCLFPRDLSTNNLFMCLIMPDTEPTNYAWLYENEVRVELNEGVNSFGGAGTIVTSSQVYDENNNNNNNKFEDEPIMATNVKNTSFNLSQYLWIR